MLASKLQPEMALRAAGRDTELTLPASEHHATAAQHKGLGRRGAGLQRGKAGIPAAGPMTPGTEGQEDGAAAGTDPVPGVLGRKCLCKSNYWAHDLRRAKGRWESQGRDRFHYEGPGDNHLLSSTRSGPAKLFHGL